VEIAQRGAKTNILKKDDLLSPLYLHANIKTIL
jgi:hypothetical protein